MIRSCVFCVLSAAFVAEAVASESPRYRFSVGEELVYELIGKEDLREDQEESERRYETEARWNVYPLRRNGDGSYRLVVKTWVKLLRYDREESKTEELGDWQEEPYVRFENTFLGYCDLMPDGSYAENPTLGQSYLFELLPELLFKPLPPAEDSEPVARVAPTSGTSYTLRWQFLPNLNPRLTGQLVRTLSANHESTNTLDIEFDAALGRVNEIVETSKSDRSRRPWHNRTTYRLVGTVRHDAEWLAEFEAAAETYFEDRNAWWSYKMEAAKARTKEECERLSEAARARIVEQQSAATMPEVRSAYDGLLALHDREMEWDIEAAEDREELYAQPPVDWATTNLAGEPRRRIDYEGKVVFLDFWYRGCGHCILALPKVKELHAKYQDRGVVFLGVSADKDVEDAHHVVDAYGIPYENLRNDMAPPSAGDSGATDAEGQMEKVSAEYKVDSWPTFIVLDQNGRVAEAVAGNAEDLVEHLSGVFDRLLGLPGAGQTTDSAADE